jgi:drug/metabolite transporter (DMT)-like permease
MTTLAQMRSKIFSRIPDPVYLWAAVFIFAASNAVTRKVTEIGAQHLIDGRNPISLCNVLFVGNLCALAVMLLVFGRQWNRQMLKQLTRRDWISLGAIALLSGALAPSLIFAALENTTVTSIVLIGRIEPPLTLALGVLLLEAHVNFWSICGSTTTFLGVAVTTFLSRSDHLIPVMDGILHIGQGELQAATAALILAIATLITKSQLQHVPLGIFSVFRVAVGTIVFFVLAEVLYGSAHFIDIFSPFLWKWMLLYGAVIVVAGQLCWLAGLRTSTPSEGILANSFSPIAAIAMAYLILGEVPTAAQYMGGIMILAGIGLSLIGNLHEAKSKKHLVPMTPAQHMEMAIGFRGV